MTTEKTTEVESKSTDLSGTPAPLSEHDEARRWLKDVYQGDKMPQLTVRSVLTGMVLGGVMALSNLYVGMKTGWGLGVTITACILAFALFHGLQAVFKSLRKKEFTVLENNMMASTASAAGYMSSSIFVGAVPALYLAAGQELSWLELTLWAAAVSFLGVFMAIPMKRQQINQEQLPFPSGIATAETLKAMHSGGESARRKASSLVRAGIFGGVLSFLTSPGVPFGFSAFEKITKASGRVVGAAQLRFRHFIPSHWFPNLRIAGQPFEILTLGFETSLVMVAAGAIIGIRIGFWMLISSLICYGVFGPWVINNGWVEAGRYRQAWALWPGVGILVAAGLTQFLLKWRTIVRAFSSMAKIVTGQKPTEADPLAHIEAPQSWFIWGAGLSGLACIILGELFFQIHWWMGLLAVVMTFFLALIASRATGETDITPTGAMGKITQLTYGLIAPGNIKTNLMTASLTGGAAIHTADLLTDLKSGYLLGANPRKQLIAQLFGVVAGTVFVVPAYLLLIPANQIGSNAWPAPAAQVWAGVARVLTRGLEALPPGAFNALMVSCAVGVVLALFEEYTPKAYRKWIPSSTAIGLAWVIPAMNTISMFIGAFVAWQLARWNKEKAEEQVVPIASGLIAGETLIGVLVIALGAMGILSTQ